MRTRKEEGVNKRHPATHTHTHGVYGRQMQYCSAAEVAWPRNVFFKMQEIMFVWYRSQQMSHYDSVKMKSVMKKGSLQLILIAISVKIMAIVFIFYNIVLP